MATALKKIPKSPKFFWGCFLDGVEEILHCMWCLFIGIDETPWLTVDAHFELPDFGLEPLGFAPVAPSTGKLSTVIPWIEYILSSTYLRPIEDIFS